MVMLYLALNNLCLLWHSKCRGRKRKDCKLLKYTKEKSVFVCRRHSHSQRVFTKRLRVAANTAMRLLKEGVIGLLFMVGGVWQP